MEQRGVGRAHHVAVHGGVVQERHLGGAIGVHSRSMPGEEWIARFFLTFESSGTLVSKAGSALNPNNCFLLLRRRLRRSHLTMIRDQNGVPIFFGNDNCGYVTCTPHGIRGRNEGGIRKSRFFPT